MTTGRPDRGSATFGQRTWGEVYKKLAAADGQRPLALDELEDLAQAAFLIGYDDAAGDAWTRAHREALCGNDPERSARNALLIGSSLLFRGETAPALGWFARAGRVLEGRPESAELAWLLTQEIPLGLSRTSRKRWSWERASTTSNW